MRSRARDWEQVSQASALVAAEQDQKRNPSAFLVRELLLAEYRRLGAVGVQIRISLLGKNIPNDPSINYLRAISGA
jgi:hypothetical protein